MDRNGVPAGLIYRAPDMIEDPQFVAREAIVEGRRIHSSASCGCRTSRRSSRRRRAGSARHRLPSGSITRRFTSDSCDSRRSAWKTLRQQRRHLTRERGSMKDDPKLDGRLSIRRLSDAARAGRASRVASRGFRQSLPARGLPPLWRGRDSRSVAWLDRALWRRRGAPRFRYFTPIFTTTRTATAAACFFAKCPRCAPLQRALNTRSEASSPTGLEPARGETVITKQYASAFFGTPLAGALRAADVDTLLIAGVSTSGCVRATGVDCIQHGFIPVIVRDAVGDRAAGPHEANLFDLQAKYAEVLPLAQVLRYLAELGR